MRISKLNLTLLPVLFLSLVSVLADSGNEPLGPKILGVHIGEPRSKVFEILQKRFPDSELSERSDTEATLRINNSRTLDYISMYFHPDGRLRELSINCMIPFEMAVKYLSRAFGKPASKSEDYARWSLRGGKYEATVIFLYLDISISVEEPKPRRRPGQ
ncbi:MAG TPA: hypothetical protein DEA96_02200 [Leptospiraceae bacterium]|nr:hypothetical protein [Spirochaetaceae bacterium]HBS03747.1 hypothetical protein [Leptospiraceae bacterium]|tara:strand:- start:29102 stop:29578 length:477 start_codon:yes stop_codon:yes gene_type:complete